MKQNKEILTGFVESLAGVVSGSQLMLRSAAEKIDGLKSDNLKNQNILISLQDEVIQNKSEQLDSVKNTVESEMKTWAGVVAKSCSNISTVTPKKLKEAVKSAVGEEDRSRNFLVYGVEEKEGEEQKLLTDIFRQIEVQPEVVEQYRIGTGKAGSNRPIKVKLRRPDAVREVLTGAKKLKGHTKLGCIFISPDRALEERAAHKQLIGEMKRSREKEPGMYFFIKRGTVCRVERTNNAPNKQIVSDDQLSPFERVVRESALNKQTVLA